MPKRRGCHLAGLVIAAAALAVAARPLMAQDAIADLRLARDSAGAALDPVPSPPGERIYHLEAGVDKLYIAFDFTAGTPTEVEVRVTGPMGAILFQETQQHDSPGTKVVVFDNKGVPFEDNEYVVNAYVGDEHYLADSLQLTVGAAVIPTSAAGQAPQAPAAEPTLPGSLTASGAASAGLPAGRSTIMLALVAMLALFGVVVWAGWSAMRRG